MKIFKKFLIVFVLIFVLGCFLVYWIEPKFSLWQMDKAIFLKKQNLPLMMMFSPPHENGRFLVEGNQPQFVLSGPRLTLFYGIYSYNLEIVPECESRDLGFMDVTRNNGNLGLGAREILTQEKGQAQRESVEFEAGMGFDYEFRLFSKGACSFEVKRAWIEREKIDWPAFTREIWQKVLKVI